MWYKRFLNDSFKLFFQINGEDLLGQNLGLYLVYTYKRYKKAEGNKIIDSIINSVKSNLTIQ